MTQVVDRLKGIFTHSVNTSIIWTNEDNESIEQPCGRTHSVSDLVGAGEIREDGDAISSD